MTKQKLTSTILTNRGNIPLKSLQRQYKIAYIDLENNVKITKKYIVETVVGEAVTITTKTGKQITLSSEQEVIIERDENIEKIKVKDVRQYDRIALL